MIEMSSLRHNLPFLVAGQAQKEIFHNEALALIDILLHARVMGEQNDPATVTPALGDGWIVGSAPVGLWMNKAGHIASWTSGGWRFLAPTGGMVAYSVSEKSHRVFKEGAWQTANTVTAPTTGAVVDSELRQTVDSLLQQLRSVGVLSA